MKGQARAKFAVSFSLHPV